MTVLTHIQIKDGTGIIAVRLLQTGNHESTSPEELAFATALTSVIRKFAKECHPKAEVRVE